MSHQVPAPPDIFSGLSYSIVGIVATAAFIIAKLSQRSKLDAIPTVVSSTWLGSWWAGIRFVTNAADVIQEGYEKHKAAPFKVAHLNRWMVIVSGRRLLEDICKSPEDELSPLEAINDILNGQYLVGPEMFHNAYHIPILRSQLTRNLGPLFLDIRDEVNTTFEEILDLKGNEWKSVPALDTVQEVVCRTANRVFVGLPLCRNPDWVNLNVLFAVDLIKAALVVGLFPRILAPLVARCLTGVTRTVRRGMKHLRPIIEKRQKYLEKHGNKGADQPNNFLSLLMEEAEGSDRNIKSLTRRVLSVNFDIFDNFTQALYNLAANPQYMQPLREEVESIVESEGWSKGALAKMRKIDSFLKESQRVEGSILLTMFRRAMKDFTFSDGTMIPKGTFLAFATKSTHLDSELYDDPDVFDPFRFSNTRDEDGEGLKRQFVSTNPKYLAFGHGKHACPGRFFAATYLKTMLAHIVVSYDIKLEDSTRPQSSGIDIAIMADPRAKGTGDGKGDQLGPEYRHPDSTPSESQTAFRRLQIPLSASYAHVRYTCKLIAAAWGTTYVVLSRLGKSDVLISMGGNDFGAPSVGGSTSIPSVPRVVNLDALSTGSSGEGTEARVTCIQSLHAGPCHVILQLHTVTSKAGVSPPIVVGWVHPGMGNLGRT
ncbi:cytochrome P450 [Melanogaster broomeanus]|nr:cytochrome P450 [Melanogaster broomeanus]